MRKPSIKKLSRAIRRRPAQLITVEGCVYFARCGDSVKIGFSVDAERRLRILQSGAPQPLELIGWMPATPASERYLHDRFRHLHVRGEWFRATRELLDYIDSVTPPRRPPAQIDGCESWP